MEFVKAAKKFRFGSTRTLCNNDFFSDRLCHRHTVKILLVFILLSTFKRLFYSPINCWIPAQLKRYEKFMNRYCWIKGTYYAQPNYDEQHTFNVTSNNETLLKYYQWVYFFLIFQAFLFYLPRMVWCFITQKLLDYDLFNIVDAAVKYDSYSFDQNKVLKFLSANITDNYENCLPIERFKMAAKVQEKVLELDENDEAAFIHLDMSLWKTIKHKTKTSLLFFTYVMMKFFYLTVAVLQIILMNIFLSNEKHQFYGGQILANILSGEADLGENSDSRIFPRISVCDVKTRDLTTEHTYTVQCVLSFNLFNERIYAFLWFWISFVVIPFVCADLAAWIVRFFLRGPTYRYRFVKNRLKIYEKLSGKKEKCLIKLFAEYYLGADAVFCLRLIEHNSNAAIVAQLIQKMWLQFKVEQKI